MLKNNPKFFQIFFKVYNSIVRQRE